MSVPAAAAPAVEVRGLTKTFGRGRRAVQALAGLDLTVAPGEVVGFLGPNGAGKTTTIRALLGLIRADGGTARVLGLDPWDDAVALHRRVAHVPARAALWPNLTGAQALDALEGLRGLYQHPARRDEVIERLDLDPSRKVRSYSTGNLQKVALAAAFSVDVDLLVLDEPTSGLDPLMEEVFRQLVREAAGRGTAVLLSSHVLSEVEALASRATIVLHGRAVDDVALRSGTDLESVFLAHAREGLA
ncbi:ABC transporter ATP-binding protein [Actinomyces radicidentis]|uniref:ABC transporter ATP-binding protein n=1 Tax=Actinomyces radicidentis TaxID=111015 RepID=UPI0036F30EED